MLVRHLSGRGLLNVRRATGSFKTRQRCREIQNKSDPLRCFARPSVWGCSQCRHASTWSQTVSTRDMADLEDRMYEHVSKSVRDPILQSSLAELQWLNRRIAVSNADVGNTATLQMHVRLPSLLHPELSHLKEKIAHAAQQAVNNWLQEKSYTNAANVNVEAIASTPIPFMARLSEDRDDLIKSLGPGLANVAHYVAVYSCKGGVGKSTVAVNLAFELARQGGRIGLLDLDLYGPSLPLLVKPTDVAIRRSPLGEGIVKPIVHHNVKLLSLGFVNTTSGVPGSGQDNGAVVMKGPMAVKVVAQLLKGTDWGDLDVLVLDLPPGTGDVQLGVLQELQLSGAVAVSTPSKLASSDTRKGIEMFTSLGVPTFAVVENMSYFEDETGKRHFPFGRFSEKRDNMDAPVVQLPISIATNDANEEGEPLTVSRPAQAEMELSAYKNLADAVSRELLLMQYGSGQEDVDEVVTFDGKAETFKLSTVVLSLSKMKSEEQVTVRLVSPTGALQKHVMASSLRCRNPKTGDLIPDSPYRIKGGEESPSLDSRVTVTNVPPAVKGKRSPSIVPRKVERKGRYGFAVQWEDGTTIIYSMLCIARAAGGTLKN